MSDADRRRAPRLDSKVPVKLRPTEGTTPYVYSGESINVSECGLLFVIDRKLERGSLIELSFTMPREVTGSSPMKVRCTGRVIRVDHKDMPEGKSGIAADIEHFETILAEA